MSKDIKNRLIKYGVPYVLLMGFWLILSPNHTSQAVVSGLALSGFVAYYSRDIWFSPEEMPLYTLKHFRNMVRFFGILLVEIVKANIDVAKIVLNPTMPINPQFVIVPMMLKNDVNKVIYGNSVTLTPGTLTVEIKNDYFVIHALTNEAAYAMKGSFIEKWILRQEENI